MRRTKAGVRSEHWPVSQCCWGTEFVPFDLLTVCVHTGKSPNVNALLLATGFIFFAGIAYFSCKLHPQWKRRAPPRTGTEMAQWLQPPPLSVCSVVTA